MATSVSRRPGEKRKATTKPKASSAVDEVSSTIPDETPSAPTPSTPSAFTDSQYTVAIRYRTQDGVQALELTTDDRSFYPYTQRWRYVVANRRRITPTTRSSLVTDITQWLSDVS